MFHVGHCFCCWAEELHLMSNDWAAPAQPAAAPPSASLITRPPSARSRLPTPDAQRCIRKFPKCLAYGGTSTIISLLLLFGLTRFWFQLVHRWSYRTHVSIWKQHGEWHRIQRDLSLMIIKTKIQLRRGTHDGRQGSSAVGWVNIWYILVRMVDFMMWWRLSVDIGLIDQNRRASTSFVLGPIWEPSLTYLVSDSTPNL